MKFCLWPHFFYSNLHLVYCQMGNFHYFPHCLAHWLSKPWHFMKICLWPHFVQQFMFYVLSNGKFLLFLFLFDTLAIKAKAFCEILLTSHQHLPFLKCGKWLHNLIPLSNCLHFSKYKLGILGVKYTAFMQNAL